MRIFHNGVKSNECKKDIPESLREQYDIEADRQDKRINELLEDKEALNEELEVYEQKVKSLQNSLDFAFSLKDIKPKINTIKDKMLENNRQAVLDKIADIEVNLLKQAERGKKSYWEMAYRNESYDLLLDNIDYITKYFKEQGICVKDCTHYVSGGRIIGPHLEFIIDE